MSETEVLAGGSYVYALVRDDGHPLPDMTGIGGSPLRLVGEGSPGLAAVVTHLADPASAVRGRDVLVHSDVLQALIADRDVVPVRFGTVYRSDEEMRRDVLGAGRKELDRMLRQVAGRVEVQVQVSYVEERITQEIAAADRRLRRLRETARRAPGDRSAQLELGRRFADLLDARREVDARSVTKRLSKVADAVDTAEARRDFSVVKVACLLPRDRLARLDREIAGIEDAGGGSMTCRALGPLPPYSFVTTSVGTR